MENNESVGFKSALTAFNFENNDKKDIDFKAEKTNECKEIVQKNDSNSLSLSNIHPKLSKNKIPKDKALNLQCISQKVVTELTVYYKSGRILNKVFFLLKYKIFKYLLLK